MVSVNVTPRLTWDVHPGMCIVSLKVIKEVLDVQKTSEKRNCEAGTVWYFSQVLLQDSSPNLALCEIHDQEHFYSFLCNLAQ